MKKYRVSAVSYINTWPFLRGLEQSTLWAQLDLSLDIPSVCAQKFLSGMCDIALVPVAVLPELDNYHLLEHYCIGCHGKVDTVCLYSNVHWNDIRYVQLDRHSRTSNALIQQLMSDRPDVEFGFDSPLNETNTARVLIGDRVFDQKEQYTFCYDLGELWKQKTGMPFAFAVWISSKKLDEAFEQAFNAALGNGITEIPAIVRERQSEFEHIDLDHYLTNRIDYVFDAGKKTAMEHFLSAILTSKSAEVYE